MEVIQKVPEFKWVNQKGGVHSLTYSGENYRGKATSVFTYFASPKTLGKGSDDKVPGIVLVHGGGGTAFSKGVELWAKRGYAAIAMDLAGQGEGRKRLPDGGPAQSHKEIFATIDESIENQWSYHAVANVVRGHSLLRSFTGVDAEREKVLETVPLLFHKATLDDLSYETGKCQKYLSHCKTWAIKPRGFLLLLGAVGNGKTHIGCAILIHHCQGMYITQNDLLNRHRQTYNDHEAPNVLKECIQTEMLVLDEVGVSQKGNDLEVILHDIINVRYVNKLPTVLISNLFGQELEDYLGLRISDRIQQAAVDMLKFDEESKRPSCRDDYLKGLEEI